MKKIIARKFLVLFATLFLFFIFGMGQIIAVGESYDDELNQTIIDQIKELDLQALQEYVDGLDNFLDESVVERLVNY